MANRKITENEGEKNPKKDKPIVFKSPFRELSQKIQIPDVSFPELLFSLLETKYEDIKDDAWVMDIIQGTSYKFSEIKPLSTKFASAITRMGFKKGDVLYFVTYDMALIFIIQIGVWMCGGAVRGCFQREDKEEFLRQMDEVSARFILCEPRTSQPVKWAAERLEWPIKLLSIGGIVEGATAVEDMIENEDGSAFPSDLKINPKEDIISFPNTSGSTGMPKGAAHTHYNLVAFTKVTESAIKPSNGKLMGKSMLTLMGNFAVGALLNISWSILFGYSYMSISKFDQRTYLNFVQKYKPESIFLYPYVANWLARTLELENHVFSFIKKIFCGGSVLDIETCKMLSKRLPQMEIMQLYGMSEILLVTSYHHIQKYMDSNHGEEIISGLKVKKLDGDLYVSSGCLVPLAEVKIIDPVQGCTVGPNIKGDLWVRVPFTMKGYVNRKTDKGFVSMVDEDGWLYTGDIAFIDEECHLYIIERHSNIFKYYMHQVAPAEIEAVIGEHPAVLTVGVVGVPDPVSTSAARAYVVLKPNCEVTEEEIKQYVAERKIFYKQLHGGVSFVDSLPESRGGKLDRPALLQKAVAELNLTNGTNLQKNRAD